VTTTDGTPTLLLAFPFVNNTTYSFQIAISARQTAGGVGRATFVRWWSAYREGGGAATLLGTPANPITDNKSVLDGSAAWDVLVDTDGKLYVQGEDGKTINWSGTYFVTAAT
jgi:hypothetical protein